MIDLLNRVIGGAYNELTAATYQRYGSVLSRTVAMTMRIIHRSAQTPDGHVPELKCSQTQFEAALALYTTIIKAKGDPQKGKLLHQLHLFMDTLLRPGHLSMDTIACPTDQLLFFLNIRDDNGYATATTVESSTAALQYSFRSILVQIVRHTFDNAETFTWFQPPAQKDDMQEIHPVDQVQPVDLDEVETEEETDGDDEAENSHLEIEVQHDEHEVLEADLDIIMGKVYTCECLCSTYLSPIMVLTL